MKHPVLGHVLGAVCGITASAILGFGCSSPAPSPNSFTNVYAKVLAKDAPGGGCTNDYCHGYGVNRAWSNLDLSSQTIAYWSLVDHLSEGPDCFSLLGKRVVPGKPDESLLVQKVDPSFWAPDAGSPPCGAEMPADPNKLWPSGTAIQATVFTGTPPTQDQIDLIRNWIADGAQNN
jgi:hypothetical protein